MPSPTARSTRRWRRRGARRARGRARGRSPNPRACAPPSARCGGTCRTRGRDRCGAMPIPVSRTRSSTCESLVESVHRDRALEGELEGIRQQIEDDLLPHLAVDVDRGSAAGDIRRSACRPARSVADRNALARSAVSAAEVGRFEPRAHPSGFDAREIQQRVHQLEQPQLVAVNRLQILAAQRASGDASASSVGPSINVSGVRNSWLTLLKNAVLARSSSASASARACASSSACAPAIAGTDLRRDEREEIAIGVVQHESRTGAGNQDAHWSSTP